MKQKKIIEVSDINGVLVEL